MVDIIRAKEAKSNPTKGEVEVLDTYAQLWNTSAQEYQRGNAD
jgi:hypothetical protein